MLRVADLDEALSFYCGGLGLVETRRYENEAGRFTLVFLAAPDDVARAKADQAPLVGGYLRDLRTSTSARHHNPSSAS